MGRNLRAILRGELARLEAELAADPRSQKAQKIRELLVMYGDPCHVPEASSASSAPKRPIAVAAIEGRPARVNLIRSAIQRFMRSKGTAAAARARLVAMATNDWPNSSPIEVLKTDLQIASGSKPTPVFAEPAVAPRLR